MSLCKWSCICFLGGLILIGWPAAVRCETSSEEKHPPGVKECRVHIEKALEQYWDNKEPDEISNAIGDNNENHLDENNPGEEKGTIRNEPTDYKNLGRQDHNDDDDEEEDNNDNAETEDNEQDSENSEELDVDEEEEEEDENGNGDEENTVNDDEDDEDDENENKEDIENDDEDTEDEDGDNEKEDEDNENEDESNENEVEANGNEDEDTENEDEDNEDGDDEDEDNDDEDENNDDENDSSDETDLKSENSNNEEQDNDEIQPTQSTSSSIHNNEDDTDHEEDDENDGNETNPKEESTENEESHANSDGNKEDIQTTEEVVDDDEEEEEGDEESKHNDDEEDEKSDTESSLLNESSETEGARSDISPEKTDTENDKATEEEEAETEEDVSTEEDDSIENIYEEEEESEPHSFRSREHIDVILGTDEVGAEVEKEEEKMAQAVFRDIRKIETTHIKPVELLYKYADSTTRTLGDAEIFSKPMLLFLGPWGTGKTSIINYLLGLERTPSALKTGTTGITDVDFSVLTYGKQRRIISGTELAADWKYAGVQKFGQGFLDHFRSIHIPHPLLQKVTIVDSPGIVENRKNAERGYSINSAFQWFIDRADAIYVVLDPSKVDIGGELGSVIEQLQGQNVRFLLNKADSIRRSDLMRVVGQLFWNLSPLLGGAEAPLIYAVSLTSHPYHPSAPAKFLADQEKNFLYDMKSTLDKRVENKILYARKHAVRVRNHAKMVDCYLASYYRHKSIFSNKRNVAKLITENPRDYSIYDGLTSMTNVSRSDVPNPLAYKEFFKIHPLYDFKPLASTCSYFRGCPMDKVDLAITKELPELLAKYKDAKRALYGQLEQDR